MAATQVANRKEAELIANPSSTISKTISVQLPPASPSLTRLGKGVQNAAHPSEGSQASRRGTGVSRRLETDEAFRRRADCEPTVQAINKAVGVQLPPGLTVTVLEESARQVYLVLPAMSLGTELSDDELATVAGELEEDEGCRYLERRSSAIRLRVRPTQRR